MRLIHILSDIFKNKCFYSAIEGRVQINVLLFYLSISFCEDSVFCTNGKGFYSRVGGRLGWGCGKNSRIFLQFYTCEFFAKQFGQFLVHSCKCTECMFARMRIRANSSVLIIYLLYVFYVHKNIIFLFLVDRHEKPVSGSGFAFSKKGLDPHQQHCSCGQNGQNGQNVS
jgi:hypothetical protein